MIKIFIFNRKEFVKHVLVYFLTCGFREPDKFFALFQHAKCWCHALMKKMSYDAKHERNPAKKVLKK